MRDPTAGEGEDNFYGIRINQTSTSVTGVTEASLLVSTDEGVSHGITVNQTQTVVSGGTTSTSLTLNDTGATFRNDSTGGPAKVTGVADGVDDYDAVNVRQLREVENKIDTSVANLEDRIDAGVASAAALAAIPEPAPGKKFSIGLGYGRFKSKDAIAAGGKMLIGNNISLATGVGYADSTATVNAGIGLSF